MILKTSKGNEYSSVRYCNYLESQQELLVCIDDPREVVDIGPEFHGLTEVQLIVRESTNYEEVRTYTGFNRLRSIEKDIYGTDKVMIYLSKKRNKE